MSNCLLHIMTVRLLTAFEYTTESKIKSTAVRISQRNLVPGVCQVCAPYGNVSLSHLRNIVMINAIATFHNGGIRPDPTNVNSSTSFMLGPSLSLMHGQPACNQRGRQSYQP